MGYIVMNRKVNTSDQTAFIKAFIERTLTTVTADQLSGVTSLTNMVFGECYQLTSVTIPSNITSMSSSTFYACYNLTSITVNKASGSISGSPWGAYNATVTWTG